MRTFPHFIISLTAIYEASPHDDLQIAHSKYKITKNMTILPMLQSDLIRCIICATRDACLNLNDSSGISQAVTFSIARWRFSFGVP